MSNTFDTDDAVNAGLRHIEVIGEKDSHLPAGARDALVGLMIQESGVPLPYAREKIEAFKAAMTAREIGEIAHVVPGDINE
jgi:hypothetical protein